MPFRIIFLIFSTLGLSLNLMAQTPTAQDCLGAIPICSSIITVSDPYPYSGNGNFLNEITGLGGCYTTENNGVWFRFTVQTAGILRFELTPTNPNTDYDWILFNVTNASCATIGSLAVGGIMARSNTWGAFGVNGATGVSTPNGGFGNCNGPGGANGPKWNADLNVTAGQSYILYVSNWSNSTSGFTLDFTSGTAVIFDGTPPKMDTITSNVSCSPFSSLTLDFDENILCDSVSTGDFALIGPGGTSYSITSVSSSACTGGADYDNTFIINFTPAVNTIGNYTLKITPGAGFVEDLCGNLDTLDSIQFYYSGPVDVEITSVEPLCNSYCTGIMEANSIGGAAPYSFTWDNGLAADSLQDSICAGIYIVTITDNQGCTASDTVVMNEPTALSLNLDTLYGVSCPGVSLCNGGAEVGVSGANPPYSYSWADGSSSALNGALCAGDNWVTVTDTYGCFDSIKAVITVPNIILTKAIKDTTICISNVAAIAASSTGGTPPFSYSWTRDSLNGAFVTGTQFSLVSPIETVTYFVQTTDVNGCVGDTSEMTVFVRPPLEIDIPKPDTICPYDEITITAAGVGGDSNYTYSWSTGVFGNSITVGPDFPTYYFVTVSDACGTPNHRDSVFVQVGGYSDIQATIVTIDDSLCLGENTVLSADARGGFNGPAEYRYKWNDGAQTTNFITAKPSKTRDYIITISDLCLSVPGIDTITIYVDEAIIPEVKFTPSRACDHASVTTSLSETPKFYHHYQWTMGDGTIYNNVNSNSFDHDYTAKGCYDIYALLETDFGCVAHDTFLCGVKILEKPSADFVVSPSYPSNLEPILDLESTSLGAKKVYWYIENSFIGNDEQIKYEFIAFDEASADTFQVILIAESKDACFDTLTKYLPFKYETIFYIPTGFTPNGDGLNDVFYIEGEGIKTEGFEFSIFDRWGNELFRTEDPKAGWNGIQNNGEYFQQGAYSYVLKYIDKDNEPKAIRGEITISRSGPKKGL
ncbi:MAG: gliding motility-associated C-terminal domain-containing protein [Salibacteraceae bacterium]|nr:gliding motility-associated C-terminal domain-containing protein [Salibacteraceae bacterium]